MEGAVFVDSGKSRDEMFFESRDGALSGVDPMVVGVDKVNVHIIFADVCYRRAAAGSMEISNVHVCVDVTRSPLGSRAVMGLVVGVMLVAGAVDVRKWLVAPESRIAQSLTVLMSRWTVRSRAVAARAYLRVGVRQWVDKLRFNLLISSLATPNRQKLLNHT